MIHISEETRDAADELGCEVCEDCGGFYSAVTEDSHDCPAQP